jgi:hypothetical protein
MRSRGAGGKDNAGILGILLVAMLSLPAQAASPGVQVTPNEVEIGAFFDGASLKVAGEFPAGAEVVMEIIGQTQDAHLMRKGRRGGLWMNVGEITIQGAPSLYLAAATDAKLLAQAPGDATWGYAALGKRIKFAGEVQAGEETELFQQFLKLKESEGLYGELARGMEVSSTPGGGGVGRGIFQLSGKIRPGTYRVRLSVVAQGQVVEQKGADLIVRQTGFPALLYSLAYEHAAAYGILAVVIALVTGGIMGLLFTGKGGGGAH